METKNKLPSNPFGDRQPPPPPPKPLQDSKIADGQLDDFRTAKFDSHWNDPPTKIFEKSNAQADHVQVEYIPRLQALVDSLQQSFTNGPDKKITSDIVKRLGPLLDEAQAEQMDKHVAKAVDQLCTALEAQDWAQANQLHGKLMMEQYNTHGQWLLGVKRLINLTEKLHTKNS
ncbi:hypothetical protein BC940DRAFT_306982 [Gongronella butleri]|nr:hypothetical protein BC940DRAFT_306982 [Gongronella butleri]